MNVPKGSEQIMQQPPSIQNANAPKKGSVIEFKSIIPFHTAARKPTKAEQEEAPAEISKSIQQQMQSSSMQSMEDKQIPVEPAKPKQQTNLEKQQKKMRVTKTEAESIKAAKGKYCVSHPWRPAYAVCNECNLSFCYADLTKYDGNFYCLDDIDVAIRKGAKIVPATRIVAIISILSFIATVSILLILFYSQFQYILNIINQEGIFNFAANISPQYYLPLVDILAVFINALAILMMVFRFDSSININFLIGGVTLMFISYEYLVSGDPGLLIPTVTAIISMASLTFGRMSSVKVIKEEDVVISDFDWPRPEVF